MTVPTTETLLPTREDALRAALAGGFSIRSLRPLLQRFGSLAGALADGGRALQELPGIGSGTAERLRRAGPRALVDLERKLERYKISIHLWGYPDYPEALADGVPDAPVVLFRKGEAAALEAVGETAVAVVGTRRPTLWGEQFTRRLGRDLGGVPLTVVSGLADGIDTCAHQGCLEGKGRTVAVLAHGLDTVHPSGNRKLADRITASGGALVSEYPPGVPARKHTFVPRNRIIAGLARAVVVVEGAEESGARHTADFAGDYQRHLLAVPGRPGEEQTELPHKLIREGAALCRGAWDVLAELFPEGTPRLQAALDERARLLQRAAERRLRELGPDAVRIVESLDTEPRHVDELCHRTGLAAPRVLALLLEMEMDGIVEQVPGMRYLANWRPVAEP